jgi:hypothetical protein
MEPMKRIPAGGTWDHLLEEIVNLITVKVAETSEAPLNDLHSQWLCNKAMKRASSSYVITNCFNLNHHYRSTVWGYVDTLNAYLKTVDWLQGANNKEALIVKGVGDICTACPSGPAPLA